MFRGGEPLVARRADAESFTSDPAYRTAIQHKLRAFCDLPLISRGRVLGVLALSSRDQGAFRTDDVEFLRHAAGQIAIAVENGLLHDELHELRQTVAREKVYLEDEIRCEMNFEEIIGTSALLCGAY